MSERNIFEYKIVIASSIRELTEYVNSRLTQQWVPQGGVCFTQSPIGHCPTYIQAMVKYE